MEHYKVLAGFGEDAGAMVEYIGTLSSDEMEKVLKYLVDFKRTRDKIKKESEARKKEELGVTPQWDNVRRDPEKYQRRLEYNREYRRRKKCAVVPEAPSSERCGAPPRVRLNI